VVEYVCMRRLPGTRLGIAGLAGAAVFVGAPAASAAVTIGSDLPAPPPPPFAQSGCTPTCTFGNSSHPVNPTASPIDGVVVRWRTRFGESFTGARLRVVNFTPTGTPMITGIRTGPATNVPTGLQEFALSPGLPISIGNEVGVDITGDSTPAAFRANAMASGFFEAPAAADGATTPSGSLGSQEVLLNADVEPDADGDGFGDETQDQCPSDASTQGPCPVAQDTEAPETTITRQPKDKLKTRKRRARANYEFVSSEPGSSFECRLDSGPFEPCTSPDVEKVKAKRKAKPHEFGVRATDAAGNVDPTPATDDFKLKRRG
jgi:hypothetical protein